MGKETGLLYAFDRPSASVELCNRLPPADRHD